jgi:Tfp pilus assembly protein PilF
MAGHAAGLPIDPAPESNRRLDSWKQIARYLNRHVTTVRRWERHERLPVHRHRHARLGSVYAYPRELDDWLSTREDRDAFLEHGECATPLERVAKKMASHQRIASATSEERVASATPEERSASAIPHESSAKVRTASVASALLLAVVVSVAWFSAGTRLTLPRGTLAAGVSTYGTADVVARDQFLQARFFFNRRQPGDLAQAEASFRRAIQLDTGFARAWAGLAGVYYVAAYEPAALGITREVALERLREAADRALLLDPNLAEAHVRRAHHRMETGDLRGARQQIRHAAQLAPNDPLVLAVLAGDAFRNGDAAEAVRLQRRVVAQDPLTLGGRAILGMYLFSAGRFDEATAELTAVLQLRGAPLAPDDESALGVAWDLARSMIAERRFDDARAFARAWPDGPWRDHMLALAEQGLGHEASAEVALRRLSTTTRPEFQAAVAEVYAVRGDAASAFQWLARASEQGRRIGQQWPAWKMDVRYSPFLVSLHGDPRWQEWLAANPPPA